MGLLLTIDWLVFAETDECISTQVAPATGNILTSCIRHPVSLPWRHFGKDWGGGWRQERGFWGDGMGGGVWDTGCNELVGLIGSLSLFLRHTYTH